jgi:leucyl aminopeptidase (aminopeptidase T)
VKARVQKDAFRRWIYGSTRKAPGRPAGTFLSDTGRPLTLAEGASYRLHMAGPMYERAQTAIRHLFEYLDVRPGVPLLVYERTYEPIVAAATHFATAHGKPLRTQPVEHLSEDELFDLLSSAEKFVCAFNRQYRTGLSRHVQVMIERATTLAQRAYTLSDVSEVFFDLFQVPPKQIVELNQCIDRTLASGSLLHVTNPCGTDLFIPLSDRYNRVHIDGFADAALDLTVNLPPGEIATYSDGVHGVIRFRGGLLGTIPIGRKYGFIDQPITFVIEKNRVVTVEAPDPALQKDLEFCLDIEPPYTRCVCEIGFGTHPAIRSLLGLNYTYEEKHYGFHLGFGATLAQQNVERMTGHHLDLLFSESRVEIDGRLLFDGEYHV